MRVRTTEGMSMNIRRLLPFVCAKATWSEVISTISPALVSAYYLDLRELELNDVDMMLSDVSS